MKDVVRGSERRIMLDDGTVISITYHRDGEPGEGVSEVKVLAGPIGTGTAFSAAGSLSGLDAAAMNAVCMDVSNFEVPRLASEKDLGALRDELTARFSRELADEVSIVRCSLEARVASLSFRLEDLDRGLPRRLRDFVLRRRG